MARRPLQKPQPKANEEDLRAGARIGLSALVVALFIPTPVAVPISLLMWGVEALERYVTWGLEESTEPNVFQFEAANQSLALTPIYLPLWFVGFAVGSYMHSLIGAMWSAYGTMAS